MDGRLRPEEDVVVLGGNARQRFYDSRGYGRPARGPDPVGPGGLVLSRVEAAHLLYRGDLDGVVADGDTLDFRGFLVRAGAAGRGSGADGGADSAGQSDTDGGASTDTTHAPGDGPAGGADHGFLARYFAYADLRDRGFYLSPAREGWPGGGRVDPLADFAVYERGHGPGEGAVAYRVRAVGERASLRVGRLGGHVLAVVDEESDVTYFQTDRDPPEGDTDYDAPRAGAEADLLADRAVCWSPPGDLYERGFFGRPLPGHGPDALQLSLVEAAYLAARGTVALSPGGTAADADTADAADAADTAADADTADATDTADAADAGPGREVSDDPDGEGRTGADAADGDPSLPVAALDGVPDAPDPAGYRAALARGRAVEGERFDRRLRVYAAVRARSLVPRTGFKFGADFRTYADVESVEDLGHSEALVRALPAGAALTPRELALDVRLAHGVRKRMTFALVDGGGDGDSKVAWRSVSRLTP